MQQLQREELETQYQSCLKRAKEDLETHFKGKKMRAIAAKLIIELEDNNRILAQKLGMKKKRVANIKHKVMRLLRSDPKLTPMREKLQELRQLGHSKSTSKKS